MSNIGNYLFIASMDVQPEKEILFNEVYDLEHVPTLLTVPGVIHIFRTVREKLRLSMGGQNKEISFQDEPKYAAFYEIESPEVLISDPWAMGFEEGRWPSEVRPFTFNRRHILRKITN